MTDDNTQMPSTAAEWAREIYGLAEDAQGTPAIHRVLAETAVIIQQIMDQCYERAIGAIYDTRQDASNDDKYAYAEAIRELRS